MLWPHPAPAPGRPGRRARGGELLLVAQLGVGVDAMAQFDELGLRALDPLARCLLQVAGPQEPLPPRSRPTYRSISKPVVNETANMKAETTARGTNRSGRQGSAANGNAAHVAANTMAATRVEMWPSCRSRMTRRRMTVRTITQTAASETKKATSITAEDGRGARIRTWDRTDISRLL